MKKRLPLILIALMVASLIVPSIALAGTAHNSGVFEGVRMNCDCYADEPNYCIVGGSAVTRTRNASTGANWPVYFVYAKVYVTKVDAAGNVYKAEKDSGIKYNTYYARAYISISKGYSNKYGYSNGYHTFKKWSDSTTVHVLRTGPAYTP